MFRLTASRLGRVDTMYSVDIKSGHSYLLAIGWKLLSVDYVYKRLGMYWELNSCYNSFIFGYKTFKQLSHIWFKKNSND